MALSEFELIERLFNRPTGRDDVVLSVGDDAALVRFRPGMELAIAVDTLVAGVHFPFDTSPEDIGYKALAVNLSDMAAMGAEPAWATLALTTPHNDEAWLESFARGFFALAQQYGVTLIGGDTTRGALSVTVQIHGWVPTGKALRRSGAKVGEAIYVSGTLGDAGIGLLCAQRKLALPKSIAEQCVSRLNRPTPRVTLGGMLRELAHAAIDISDGLSADLGHILKASRCGARIEIMALPLSAELQTLQQHSALSKDEPNLAWPAIYEYALSAGDDYELLFTAPLTCSVHIEQLAREHGVALTRVGTIEAELGLRLVDGSGQIQSATPRGYRHF